MLHVPKQLFKATAVDVINKEHESIPGQKNRQQRQHNVYGSRRPNAESEPQIKSHPVQRIANSVTPAAWDAIRKHRRELRHAKMILHKA